MLGGLRRPWGRYVLVFCAAALLAALTAAAAAADTTLGTTTVGSSSLTGADMTAYGNVYTLSSTGTVTSLSLYISASSSSQSFTPVIYSAPGGAPGALAAQGPQATITAGTTGWVTVPINPTSLPSGNYLVGLLFANTGGGFSIAATPFGTGQDLYATTMSSDTNPDDPWPASATYQDTISVYALLKVKSGTKAKPAPPQTNDIFLCSSKFQVDPDVFDSKVVPGLLAAGYWIPYALAGNVDGGTNLGDFHLVCNLTSTQKPIDGLIDGGGDSWSSDYVGLVGLYPKAG